ncbi:MAG: arylsulfatase [Ginsengibacter sp.]
MKRFAFLFIAFIITSSLNAQDHYPNIIYILADDMGYGDVSCLNKDSKINTKNIDALAAEGMKFTDAHSNSAVCTPTRYGVLTGRYAWRTWLQSGVLWSYDSMLIDKSRMTVASLLQKNGYHTAAIGKWHLGLGWQKNDEGQIDLLKGITEGPTDIGFDYFYGITASLDIPPYVYIENHKVTATAIDTIQATTGKGFWRKGPIGNDFKHEDVLPNLTKHAIDYIKQQSATGNPFFLYMALPSPHTPILPAKEYLGKTGTNAYGDFVLMTDDMIGKILQSLKDAGVENNTLIIFTSDNGCSPMANFEELKKAGHNPSYIFRGAKADIFEGGHHIPFMVKWPGKVKAGTVNTETICLTDFMATCADLLNEKLPDNAAEDSYDLMPLLTGNGKFLRTNTIHHSIDGNFSIRQGLWKLEFCSGSGGWSYPTKNDLKTLQLPAIQLYDLYDDWGEQKNVVSAHKRMATTLTKEMKQIVEDGRSTGGTRQKNDVEVDYLKRK